MNQVLALWDFKGTTGRELELKRGDVIDVEGQYDEHWCVQVQIAVWLVFPLLSGRSPLFFFFCSIATSCLQTPGCSTD